MRTIHALLAEEQAPRSRHWLSYRVAAASLVLCGLVISAVSATSANAADPPALLTCDTPVQQGGATTCFTTPGARIRLGNAETRADADGFVVLGFDRDAPAEETALIELPDGTRGSHRFRVESRSYAVSRIDGLPASVVDTFTAAQRKRIASSSARKKRGDASRAALAGFRERFAWPLEARRTTAFGAQRILNGVPKRPHYGVDLAAPKGTAIRSPAAGVVTLADEDLYFEGAMIVIDHGQGFLSKYLHVSRIDVAVGQRVGRGDVIGAVGSRGRSTGPHLCWRLKWRDRNLDPELWIAPTAGAAPASRAGPR